MKKQKFIKKLLLTVYLKSVTILIAAAFISGPVFSQDNPDDKILARIGSKEITVKEFLERCELTARPANFKDRYITLNNLVTEKILALEAEKDDRISENVILQRRIKGIKEQAMRDKLYDKIAFSKIKTDSAELENAYRASLREYEVEFYNIKSKELANDIETILDTIPELSDEIFRELERSIDKKPVKKVNFKDKDDDVILESLFSNIIDTGTVVGPLKLKNGTYILTKVLNWTDYPLFGMQEQAEQWERVKQTMHEIKARKIWLAYQTELMKDKRFEFDKNSFNALADAAMQYYIGKPEDGSLNLTLQELPGSTNIPPDAPFFTVNNEVWSIRDFKAEMISHPLIFRTKHLDENNFKRQFQYAVVDMMRDYYLNQEAYKLSLDNSDEINKSVNTWKDSFFAVAEMNKVIQTALTEGIIHSDNNMEMLKYKESYISNIQKKYNDLVSINFEEFEKISLTNIDFMAMRPDVPFPNATPSFPLLIRSDNLEYAKNNGSLK
ncbi:MAG: hypothetical protein R6W90_09935 [Ignavibacteriaceae bacterium]